MFVGDFRQEKWNRCFINTNQKMGMAKCGVNEEIGKQQQKISKFQSKNEPPMILYLIVMWFRGPIMCLSTWLCQKGIHLIQTMLHLQIHIQPNHVIYLAGWG